MRQSKTRRRDIDFAALDALIPSAGSFFIRFGSVAQIACFCKGFIAGVPSQENNVDEAQNLLLPDL
jgi:hypothetical protein